MKPHLSAWLLAMSLLAAAIPCAGAAGPASLQVTEVWSRPTAAGAGTGAGFLRIRNAGLQDERLLGASSARAGRVELHQLVERGGVAGMRPLAEGLLIPAGGEVRLAPSGSHLMLFDLQAPLRPGERVPLDLHFERAGTLPVALQVESPAPEGPQPPAAGDHGHH